MPRDVDIGMLQQALVKNGVLLDPEPAPSVEKYYVYPKREFKLDENGKLKDEKNEKTDRSFALRRLLLSAAACTNAPAGDKSTDASNQDGEQRLRIVATLQSQQINFWSNVQHTLERLAKEENVDLTIMDLNGDVTTFANVIDDFVAMKPDGVITCGLETSTLGIHVKTLQGRRHSRRDLQHQPGGRNLPAGRCRSVGVRPRRRYCGGGVLERKSPGYDACRRCSRSVFRAAVQGTRRRLCGGLPHRLSRL